MCCVLDTIDDGGREQLVGLTVGQQTRSTSYYA